MRKSLFLLLTCLPALALNSALYRGDVKKGEIELQEEVSVFKNKWVEFYNDKVKFPNGKTGTYIRVTKPNTLSGKIAGSAVLALTPNRKVILERTFRHPIRSWLSELPRGGIEGNETLQQTGERELREETGYVCKKWDALDTIYPDTGILDYQVALFLARDCEKKTTSTETEEAIQVELTPWLDFLNQTRRGQIKDAMSVAAALRAEPFLAPGP